MQKFNRNKYLDEELVSKIEKYFEFRWKNDRSIAISEPEDVLIFE